MNNDNKISQLRSLLAASAQGTEDVPSGLVDLIPIGMTFVEVKSGMIVWCNDQLSSMLGYEPGELWGKMTVYELTPEHDWDFTQSQLDSVATFGRFGWYEKDYKRKDGSVIRIQIKGYSIEIDGTIYAVTVVDRL